MVTANKGRMKICGIIIVYNPRIAEVRENIASFISGVDTLLIWENSPLSHSEVAALVPEGYENRIVRMGGGRNSGIAYPLNRAVEYARTNGYTHLLSMDQDSRWEDFAGYKAFVEGYDQNHIFAPRINNVRSTDKPCERRRLYINSGAIYPLSVIKKVGLFNEDFFIDSIDTEYAIRAHREGIQVMQFNDAVLNHQLGYHTMIKGHDVNCYSPMRLYYLNRNGLKMFRNLHNREALREWLYHMKIYFFRRGWQIIRFEDSKREKLGAIFRGLWSGMFSKL